MPSDHHLAHGRADVQFYEQYYVRMDATRRHKVALTSVEFAAAGAVLVDQGFGTGATTFDLANLYPRNRVIGIDIDPNAVAHAKALYSLDNLQYILGDAARPALPAGSVDGFLNSSVWHEILSYASKDKFSLTNVLHALDMQVRQLKAGGKVVVRDFVRPSGPERVVLELPDTDGASSGSIKDLSSCALLADLVARFRCTEFPQGGLASAVVELPRAQDGWRRFEMPHYLAAEFVLRKDYRDRWNDEMLEQYTYMTQARFQDEFRARHLRTHSIEIRNPWIIENRFEGKFRLTGLDGRALPYPATNFLIVGEKVRDDEGVQLHEKASAPLSEPSYLSLERYKLIDPSSSSFGKVFELARRPHPTVDVVPWFEENGSVQVMVKAAYPRPILSARHGDSSLDGAQSSGYITEHLSGQLGSGGESPESAALRVLEERGAISDGIESTGRAHRYYSSPGGVDEQVVMVPVKIEPRSGASALPDYSNLSTSGTFRPMDAHQIIRACQVGGLFDARLEASAYQILLEAGKEIGPWIGADIALKDRASDARVTAGSGRLFPLPVRQAFAPARPEEGSGYLEVRRGTFQDLSGTGTVLAETTLEYVTPRPVSNNTISVLPVTRMNGEVYAAVEIRDLPAIQLHEGSSCIAAAPSFRVPRECRHSDDALDNVGQRLLGDFGLKAARFWPLGGKYFPSPGVIPEAVHPYLAEVDSAALPDGAGASKSTWVPLRELVAERYALKDLQLLVCAMRAAHALGILSSA